MSSELNVSLWAQGVLGPGETANWFWDISPADYNARLRRVRTFSAVPFVSAPDPGGTGLPLPPDPPYPTFEQRIEVTDVFHLLKATPLPPPGTFPPGAPALQINVIVSNLSDSEPVTYHIYMSETDN
jgi:hypothetical protein